jgi:hypothetical protein
LAFPKERPSSTGKEGLWEKRSWPAVARRRTSSHSFLPLMVPLPF